MLTGSVRVDLQHVEENLLYTSTYQRMGGAGQVVRRPDGGAAQVPVTCPVCGTELIAEVCSLPETRRRRKRSWILAGVSLAAMIGTLLLVLFVTIGMDTASPSLCTALFAALFLVAAIVSVVRAFDDGVSGGWPRGDMSRAKLFRRVPRGHRLISR